MADTLFPKREERVPYGSGTPAGRDRKNTKGKKTGRTNRNKPTEKKRGKKDGKKLNRNALYLIGIIVILFIVFLFVRKNGSAVYIADEQVGILETRKVTAKELTATLESQLEGIVGSKVHINEKIKVEGIHIGSKEKKDVCTMEHLLPKMRSKVIVKRLPSLQMKKRRVPYSSRCRPTSCPRRALRRMRKSAGRRMLRL